MDKLDLIHLINTITRCEGSNPTTARTYWWSCTAKSSSNIPVMQRTRRAHKERGWYAPHDILLASCPSGRRSGWAVRRFDSLVLSEVSDVVLCLCAQGEGEFLRIAP